MKRILRLTAIALAAMPHMALASCTQKDIAAQQTTVVSGGSATADTEEKTTEKRFHFDNFSAIMVKAPIKLCYTRGNSYKLTVKTTKKWFDRLNISCSGNCLEIETTPDDSQLGWYYDRPGYGTAIIKSYRGNGNYITSNSEEDCIRIDITAPDIRTIYNEGMLYLHTYNLDGSTLAISNKGSLSANFNKSVLKTLDIDNKGALDITESFSGENVMIDNYGSVNFAKGCRATGTMKIANNGAMNIASDISTKDCTIDNKGSFNGKCNIKSTTLDISNYGTMALDADFKGGKADIYCPGLGNMTLNVDCKSIDIDSNGLMNITLSGTGEKTDIRGTGSVKVNTEGYNRF